jgi:hypothetical protein
MVIADILCTYQIATKPHGFVTGIDIFVEVDKEVSTWYGFSVVKKIIGHRILRKSIGAGKAA